MNKSQGSNGPQENDHRKLGQKLDLFSFHDVAPGAVFWHGKGMIIWRELERYLREKLDAEGYEETSTPIMVKKSLFEKSGHWDHYKENMFLLEVDGETYVLKPMNCPEHTLIYSSRIRSWRDLPIRYSEITDRLHRKELSGVLGGLLRVVQFTQDDAHIFARPDQIEEEIEKSMNLVKEFYKKLGLPVSFNLATKPESSMGDPKLWEKAEGALENVLKKSKVKYKINAGDGAFYGPKIDINLTDSQNREWTVATIQLDFQMPERFGLEYIAQDNSRQTPVMIHRAILGAFERFIGILLEHFAGALPFWLSPVQVAVLALNDEVADYAKDIAQKLREKEIRTFLDDRRETINKKIREAELQKIPYLIVAGAREAKAGFIAVRQRGRGDLGQMTLQKFLDIIKEEVENKN